MMLFLCLSAGTLYWGVLVFGITTDTFFGKLYWMSGAFLGFLASCLGGREILKTLGWMYEAHEIAVEVMESAEAQTKAEKPPRSPETL